jgi:hypothetical protein
VFALVLVCHKQPTSHTNPHYHKSKPHAHLVDGRSVVQAKAEIAQQLAPSLHGLLAVLGHQRSESACPEIGTGGVSRAAGDGRVEKVHKLGVGLAADVAEARSRLLRREKQQKNVYAKVRTRTSVEY